MIPEIKTIIEKAEQEITNLINEPVKLVLHFSGFELNAEEVLLHVTKSFGMSVDEIKSNSRTERQVNARRIVVKLLIDRGFNSTVKLGQLLNRHHSSIIHLRDSYYCVENHPYYRSKAIVLKKELDALVITRKNQFTTKQ